MRLRFVTASQHAVLDYALDAGLFAVPLLLGFTGLAFWLSVGAGALNVGYSLLTSYRGGLVKLLPFRVHLGVDAAVGVLFVAVALLAGFAGWALAWYLAAGIGIGLAVLPDPRRLISTRRTSCAAPRALPRCARGAAASARRGDSRGTRWWWA